MIARKFIEISGGLEIKINEETSEWMKIGAIQTGRILEVYAQRHNCIQKIEKFVYL